MSRSLRILNGHGKSMLPVAQALNFFVVVIESNGESVRQIDMDKILTISRMCCLIYNSVLLCNGTSHFQMGYSFLALQP